MHNIVNTYGPTVRYSNQISPQVWALCKYREQQWGRTSEQTCRNQNTVELPARGQKMINNLIDNTGKSQQVKVYNSSSNIPQEL